MTKRLKTPDEILTEVNNESPLRKNYTFSLHEQLMKDFFKCVGEASRSRVVEKLIKAFVVAKQKPSRERPS